MFDFTLARFLDNSLLIPGAILGYVLHELAHAFVAYALGDHGPELRKRLTLNPLRHVPLIGLPLFVLFGFAWARPLRVNPGAYAHPHRAVFFTALSGPLANLLVSLALYAGSLISLALALIALPADAMRGPVFRFYFGGGTPGVLSALIGVLTFRAAQANLALALVNLVPLPPFDGFWAIYALWRGLRRQQAVVPGAGRAAIGKAPEVPADVVALFREGAMLQAGRKWAQAAEVYQRVLAQDPRERRAAYALGQVYERLGQPSEAARAYGRAYALSGDDEERRQVAARLDELHVALADALAAQPAAPAGAPGGGWPGPEALPPAPLPGDAPLRVRWQWVAVTLGALLVLLTLYVGVFPGAAVGYTGAGGYLSALDAARAAFAANDSAGGETVLRQALELSGDVYAQAAYQEDRTRAAASIAAIAAEAPGSPAAAVLRAVVDLDAGRPADALERLQALPDQRDYFVKFYEASAYIDAGRWAEAQQALVDALAARPDAAAAHSNLAFVYAHLGQYDQAAAEAEAAVSRDATFGPGWTNRSVAYLHDPAGSQPDLASGAAILGTLYAPGRSSAHAALATALLANGQPEWAADELREAERLRGTSFSPYY